MMGKGLKISVSAEGSSPVVLCVVMIGSISNDLSHKNPQMSVTIYVTSVTTQVPQPLPPTAHRR